ATQDRTMKWDGYPNLRKRPPTPAKARGSIQRAIRRAFAASGAEALTSAQIYDWGIRSAPAGSLQDTAGRRLFAGAADAPGDVLSGRPWHERRAAVAVATLWTINRCVEKPSQKQVS